MPIVQTEGVHGPEFLKSEANGSRSRSAVIIASGADLEPGTILGKQAVSVSAPVADGGNTGTGTFSATPSADGNTLVGDYVLTVTGAIADGGEFVLETPAGDVIDAGFVGTAVTGHLDFTLTDGATDFVVGDKFTITVSAANGKYKRIDPTAEDGSSVAAGILYAKADAASADVDGVVIDLDAQVVASKLVHSSGADAAQIALELQQLRALGIKVVPEA
ncbi:MAG: hypothetical protein Alpg2KO_00920 [Alphaproteobacteria bacterium]